jgi:hypothetical protein
MARWSAVVSMVLPELEVALRRMAVARFTRV